MQAAADAAARLDSYERAARAAAARRGGPLLAPVQLLDDEQLAALFAPRQAETLVLRPFGAPARCGARQSPS